MVFVPDKIPVTTTDAEQLAPGGITEPLATTSDEPPGAATTEELEQVVAARGAAALLMPLG